jgi:Spy/CpxP family protein refolding chaperone
LLQAPEGTPPDVWQQIPGVVLRAASDNFELFVDREEALNSLLRGAASASLSAAQRLTEVEKDLQDMRQQMAQMQDSMAAVLDHLQLAKDLGCKKP